MDIIAYDCTEGYSKETHGVVVPIGGPNHGMHLIPFRTWEEYESYLEQKMSITKSWLDLKDRVKIGKISKAEYHDKLRNEWYPSMNSFIETWDEKRVTMDLQRSYSEICDALNLPPQTWTERRRVSYELDVVFDMRTRKD